MIEQPKVNLDLWIRVLLNEKPKEIITRRQLKEVFGIEY